MTRDKKNKRTAPHHKKNRSMPNPLTISPNLDKTATKKATQNWQLLLAHGAGAPMTSPFLETLCQNLADQGIATTRFEFSYMAARRRGKSRRPPPKAQKLIPEYLETIKATISDMPSGSKIAIGGKSMGGRIASMIAQDCFLEDQIHGLVCLGYPFHPPKKPQNLRTAHLMNLTCPTLIIQGERDPLGNTQEVKSLGLPPIIKLHWSPDGDHDLKPRVRSGHTQNSNILDAARTIADFLQQLR